MERQSLQVNNSQSDGTRSGHHGTGRLPLAQWLENY